MSYSPLDINKETGNSSADAGAFERVYMQLRKKEQRLYTDEEVRHLPQIATTHPYFKEWQIRKRSCDRLIKYLDKKNKPLHILEIGCGNGWLSAQLARNTPGQVLGIDINQEELTQGARVFSDISNLKFVAGNLSSAQPEHRNFDIIVFAASLQYFSSLKETVQSAFQYLQAGGEVHIIDTIFYKKNNVDAARQRTKDYYTALGFPEATDYYYHHRVEDLINFSPKILYDPSSWIHKFGKNKYPFFWVCIKRPGNPESNP